MDTTDPIMGRGGGNAVNDETKDQRLAPEVLNEISAIIARAKVGDETAVPRLRELLNAHPLLWQWYGDMGAQTEKAWVVLIAGKDLHLHECLLQYIADMKQNLAGASASPLERLVIQRIVACWLQLQ